MNGVSLLLTLASLGPTYSPRTGIDQQQEYVLQIEPEIVQLLTAGEEIFSDIPPNAGPFQRLCITILPKDSALGRHTPAGEEQFRNLLLEGGRYASRERTPLVSSGHSPILWPARAGANPDQTSGVMTGWESDAKGSQQYIVQLDPTLLSTLAIGDELYVPVDPAAGGIVRFIVKTGREPLPHVGSQSAGFSQSPLAQRQPSRYSTGLTDSPAKDFRGPQWNTPPNYTSSTGGAYAPVNPPGLNPAPPITGGFDSYRNPATPDGEGTFSSGFPPPPLASQQPQLPGGPRPYSSQYPDARIAGRSPVANTPPLNPGMYPPAGMMPPQDKPWGPLLFVTFALFFSIGGNLYLAYTALEFHSRYRNAIERLRSAARSA